MKKAVCIIVGLFIALSLTACGGKNTANVSVVDWEPSEIYLDEDIKSAVQITEKYFEKEFNGCTLTEISYWGDDPDLFDEWAKQYDADEAIVLLSSFNVGESGGDGSLKPNTAYTNWQWILVRNNDGEWNHATHGYS